MAQIAGFRRINGGAAGGSTIADNQLSDAARGIVRDVTAQAAGLVDLAAVAASPTIGDGVAADQPLRYVTPSGNVLYRLPGAGWTDEPSSAVFERWDLGDFPDLASADAALGGAVPAGEFRRASLADGTDLYAAAGDTGFTAETPTVDNATLHVAQGNTIAVPANGSLIIAEQDATVTVPTTTVTAFTIVEDTSNPWTETPLTTPDITFPAGTTLHPSAQVTTATNGGGPLTVYLPDGETEWRIAQNGPAAASANTEEVGEGNQLPADGSTWELFRLRNSGSAATDGLWMWDGDTPTVGSWRRIG